MAYAFDFIGPDGRIDHVQVGYYRDDSEAVRDAQVALSRSRAVAVTIWTENRRVGQVEGAAA